MSDRVQQILNSLRRDLVDIGSPNEELRTDEFIGATAQLAEVMDFEEKHFRNWIEYRFGVELSSGEANGVLDPPSNGASSANGLTWLRLAALINERLAHADFQPVEICGNRCATAGAFRSLERIARCLDPDCSRFAPSTPIFERLQGRGLERFLAQTRFLSGITLGAPVDLFQRFVAVVSYAVLAIIAFLLLVFAMSFVTAFLGMGSRDAVHDCPDGLLGMHADRRPTGARGLPPSAALCEACRWSGDIRRSGAHNYGQHLSAPGHCKPLVTPRCMLNLL